MPELNVQLYIKNNKKNSAQGAVKLSQGMLGIMTYDVKGLFLET